MNVALKIQKQYAWRPNFKYLYNVHCHVQVKWKDNRLQTFSTNKMHFGAFIFHKNATHQQHFHNARHQRSAILFESPFDRMFDIEGYELFQFHAGPMASWMAAHLIWTIETSYVFVTKISTKHLYKMCIFMSSPSVLSTLYCKYVNINMTLEWKMVTIKNENTKVKN